jgi:hypothetical protein
MKTMEYDIDYESPDGIDNCMYKLKDVFNGLWNEYIDDVELLLKRDFLNIYKAGSPLTHLHHNDIFDAAKETFTPTQVIALYHFSSLEARLSGPIERKLRICDTLDNSDNLSGYNITNVSEFKEKINRMHPILFQDFTDILYNSGVMRYLCPEYNDKLKLFELKMHHANQYIIDADQEKINKIDIGDFDCLTEDDLYKDIWMVAGMDFPNHIDYFWEAGITDLCQTKRGDFFTMSRDSLSEPEHDNYSKYLCYVNDSGGFIYCNKESCEGCTNSCTKKIFNEQYFLWKKYVQPIESDEYFGSNAY